MTGLRAGASITIDGRTVFTAQDGSFTAASRQHRALTITIVAKDRAGNERP